MLNYVSARELLDVQYVATYGAHIVTLIPQKFILWLFLLIEMT